MSRSAETLGFYYYYLGSSSASEIGGAAALGSGASGS